MAPTRPGQGYQGLSLRHAAASHSQEQVRSLWVKGWQGSPQKAASSQVLPALALHLPEAGPPTWGTSIRVEPLPCSGP